MINNAKFKVDEDAAYVSDCMVAENFLRMIDRVMNETARDNGWIVNLLA